MPANKPWLTVDRKGLKELVAGRPAWYAVAELLQNAWDEDSTEVHVTLEKVAGRPAACLTVTDDNPEGFKDITHAFTLFARSDKRSNPTKRGRFNLGEKLVLARCLRAEITTTKGTIVFHPNGTRSHKRKKLDKGTTFYGDIRMNQVEYDEACAAVSMLQPPIPTYFNGELFKARPVLKSFEASLNTLISDNEGVLRTTTRKTDVHIYAVAENEVAHIYELGIPVVETGDAFHVDVQQKVPLNMDRDNVPPYYLQKLRAFVLNNTTDLLTDDEASEKWVDNALEDPNIEDDAVKNVLKARFGKKVAAYDPSDIEANHKAVSQGYTLVHGRSLSASQWTNVKRADALKPAGQVFPTKKVNYGDGDPEKVILPEDWTKEMWAVVELAHSVARVLDFSVSVVIVNDPNHGKNNFFNAWYGGRCLHLNYRRLGKKWFRTNNLENHLRLIIHELAHEYEMNHLSNDYHDACCRIGAKVALAVAVGDMEL